MAYGKFINSERQRTFNFDGRMLSAYEGDSIASALWRNGITTISRSFKYHRRRGILSLSGADANVLLDVDSHPNVNADLAAVADNMTIRSRHHWGGLENDRLALMQYAAPLLPPGFYYRAFYKPKGAWRRWEPLIRQLAGSGVVNPAATVAESVHINAECDVAVIGGGFAGIAAATAAANDGKRVMLLDKHPQLGGSANWLPAADGAPDLAAVLAALPDAVAVHHDCRATGIFADNTILAVGNQSVVDGGCLLRVRASERIVVAAGARDVPVCFAGNDLPGVMLTQAALRLAYLYDVAAGHQAVLLASSFADGVAARALRDYGIDITAIILLGAGAQQAAWAQTLTAEGFNVLSSPAELRAIGRQSVRAVHALVQGRLHKLPCDCLLMSGGKIPNAELPATAELPFAYDDDLHTLVPVAADKKGLSVAGAINGRLTAAESFADGQAAAQQTPRPVAERAPLPELSALSSDKDGFIDFDEDLHPQDFHTAVSDGFADSQLLKRWTTAGMGPAQGKLGNLLVARQLAAATGQAVSAVGAPTARPPVSAETLAQLAGQGLHPVKLTALHPYHRHLSARMMTAGEWLRPAEYTGAEAEASALRDSAGMIDVSTLGKLHVRGADAGELLERLYTGKFVNQKNGVIRYALMLDESGVIADDGVAARLADGSFWVTTTTGNAAAIYRNMLLWRARWDLDATIINMTSAYAAINIAGPRAAEILSGLFPKIDWQTGYMRCANITLPKDVPAISMRIGFVGEAGYEIHLPSGYMPTLWKCLEKVQTPCAVTPCGVEAQRLLRLEKGHIIVGQDTDGLTTPREAGMSWALGKDKKFYIGGRALAAREKRPMTQKLIGFVVNPKWRHRLHESDLVIHRGDVGGRVTSVSYSPTMKAVIGLAYAPPNYRDGDSLTLQTDGGLLLHARVVNTPFYDAAGERQK